MFSRKKIAAVAALMGGLTVACVIAPQAQAADTRGFCTRDVQGNVSCLQKTTSDDGKYSLTQQQNCQPSSPLQLPTHGVLNPGTMLVGPAVTCSNSAPVPGDSQPAMDGENRG
ncbi:MULTISPECIES: hypothetical protein [Streptomyces]|uniref:hypothetical protein n=1 Tax=Streptomyces TaxID=1883 RepID=UPI0019642611|nr:MULTISPECIES: hypothetical protein [Streptomyces]QRX96285.1 hypothetical protein JNO44_40750 [Streptomyces noursei]UJB44961.1 hypothetical protein HRD51_32980 [Streptomyces sp. A1-5]